MPSALAECRVIERRPAPGDIHPISGRQMRRIVQGIRKRYIYGLVAIELRARPNTAIGCPYGEYLNDEKKIRLFSVPFPEWRFERECNTGLFESHGATIQKEGKTIVVKWSELVDVAYFIYEVFLHELGHHFHNQYRAKRPHPRTPAAKESSADRISDVLARFPAFQGWHQE